MKTRVAILAAMLLVFVGGFASCEEKAADIDTSKIDFSNIENLYAQPLSVIQKCVQGKWKWYVEFGGVVGISYSDSTFVDIDEDRCTIDYSDGTQQTIFFTWKRSYVDMGYETWVMWEKERDKAFWCFHSIKNDTLGVGTPTSAFLGHGMGFARIK